MIASQHGHHARASSPPTRPSAPALLQKASRRGGGRYLQHGQRGRRHLHQRYGLHPGQRHGRATPAHRRRKPHGLSRISWHALLPGLRQTVSQAWPATAKGPPSCWNARVTRRQSTDSCQNGRQGGDQLQPVQGRHVRRRRQLGPRAVRHRVYRGRRGCNQGGRGPSAPTRGLHPRLPRTAPACRFSEETAKKILTDEEIIVDVDLQRAAAPRPMPGAATSPMTT